MGVDTEGGDMKERPIIMSSELVRAILEGRKTMTRRVIKPQPLKDYTFKGSDGGNSYLPMDSEYYWQNGYAIWRPNNKYQVGDRLWVREAYFIGGIKPNEWVSYKADARPKELELYVWRPSIFMPRWASRILLEITEVRVERLQEINEDDAKAEGAFLVGTVANGGYVFNQKETVALSARTAFAFLWDSLNAKRGFSWESNCWVWVISFKRV